MKLPASSATTRSCLTLFTSLFFTMRWAETELSTRLTVSLQHNFTRNLKNASCCLLFGAVASWYMEKGWAYVCICKDFGSSLRLHILFLRDFNSLLYSQTPRVTQHTPLCQEIAMKAVLGDKHRWQTGGWHTGRESWHRDRHISTRGAADRKVGRLKPELWRWVVNS